VRRPSALGTARREEHRLTGRRVQVERLGELHDGSRMRCPPNATLEIRDAPHAEPRALGQRFLGQSRQQSVTPKQGGEVLRRF